MIFSTSLNAAIVGLSAVILLVAIALLVGGTMEFFAWWEKQ